VKRRRLLKSYACLAAVGDKSHLTNYGSVRVNESIAGSESR
jgi:hypothetical protein